MRTLNFLRACSFAVAGLALGVSPAWSADYYLQAEAFTMTLPDGTTTVPMWGYNKCTGSTFATCDGPSVPGPQLTVPANDTSGLTIYLKNTLPNQATIPSTTSIVIPGQLETTGMAPTRRPDEISPLDGVTVRKRMQSFTHETTTAGDIGVYHWDLQPGTYLYHSGTHAQVQVQMGLYGSVAKDASVLQAYPGKLYDNQATLLFSEIDPALHNAVAGGTYGMAPMTSTITYAPKYFLINGKPYSEAPTLTPSMSVGGVNQRVLLRLLNAGLETHVPTLLGGHFRIIAEDGNPLPYEREQYEILLSAGKTMDALWVPAASGDYPLYDRRLRQGMLAKLGVGGTDKVIANPNSYTTNEDTILTRGAAGGVLGNDIQNGDGTLTAQLVSPPTSGTLVLNANGSFTYTPVLNFFGQASFTYQAVLTDTVLNQSWTSNVTTVTITINPVNDAPLANPDSATTGAGKPVVINVLANDTDVEGSLLSVTAAGPASNGTVVVNANYTVTYTPNAGFNGPTDTFQYTVSDGALTSIGTVTVTVLPNVAPVAVNDTATVSEDGSVAIAVLANDTDANMDPLTVASVTQGANGTVSVTATGVTYIPRPNFYGLDSFTYVATDGMAFSNPAAMVSVTVNPVPDRPIGVSDTVTVNKNGAFTVPASGVLVNDTDPDNLIAPFNAGLTSQQTSTVARGTVTLAANGSLVYTPPANYVGTQSFTYRANDGALNSGLTTVTLIKNLTVTTSRFRDRPGNRQDTWNIQGRSVRPNAVITIYVGPTVGGTIVGTATADGTGAWSFTLNVPAVDPRRPDATRTISIQSGADQLIAVPVTIQVG